MGCPRRAPTRSTPICSLSSGLKNSLAGRGAAIVPRNLFRRKPSMGLALRSGGQKIAPPGAKKQTQSQRAPSIWDAPTAPLFEDAARFETGGVRYHISADR